MALLASPILAVKNLMAMYLVHEAMIKDDEIKLLDTTNQKYVAAKAEVDQIDKAIETYNKQIEKEEKCMRLYADAALEVKRKILEGDPYEKAQRELESAIEAASSAIRAREDVRAVLSAAKDAKVKAEAAGNEIKRQKELRETIKNECDRGKKLVEQTKTAKEAAYKHYMEMKDYLNLTEREWKKACAAAARLRQTQFFSQDEMDLLEISSMQAFVKSQDASSECAKRTKLIGEEAQTAENAAEQIEKIREKLTELGNQLVDGAEIQTKLDAIMTKVDARMKETANKPVEADDFAADAQHARDRVAEILAKISSEDRAKKMIAMAEKAAESAKTAAADTKKLATEAQSLVKTLHSDIEALGKRSVNLTKEKKECKIPPVTDFVKDANASKESAELFAQKAVDFATGAEDCAAFVSKVAGDTKRGFDVKIRSVKPIVSNMLEYDPKPVKVHAGQGLTLNIEYVVFGWPNGEVVVEIDPIVMIGPIEPVPMPLRSIKRNVRFGDKENQKVYRDILRFSIPYPTSDKEPEDFHALKFDIKINEKKTDSVYIDKAFRVLGPGTDFNGYCNIGVCVVRSEKDTSPDAYGGTKANKGYYGKAEVTLQPLSRQAGSVRKVLENACPGAGMVFKKVPLGRYLVSATVQGDKGLKGARSGSSKVTYFRPHPEAGYSAHVYDTVVIQLGKSKGEERPSFAQPKKPEVPEKPVGPEAWYVQIKVEDRKGNGISGARVFSSDGVMTAKAQGGGKYELGPIKNVKNVAEKKIEVTADISFKSAHPSVFGHQKMKTVTLKDKSRVYVTIKFNDYEEGGTGLAGAFGGGGGGTPSWVPQKNRDSRGEGATGGSPPSWAGGGGGKGESSSGGGSGVADGDKDEKTGGGSGGGETTNKRSREECERELCPECFFLGQRIDRNQLPEGGADPCQKCLRDKAGLIQQCMEGG